MPALAHAQQLSVEFKDDLHTWRSNGKEYTTHGDAGAIVGVEPVHALLLFASPFLPPHLVPPSTGPTTHVMQPGPIADGAWGNSPVLFFPKGVYWMSKRGQNHMRLGNRTYWVHLARGAYVKGAVEYSSHAPVLYATGHGVLSGEHYVYQVRLRNGLKHVAIPRRRWCMVRRITATHN